MTTHIDGGTRRLRATIISLGREDQEGGPRRILTSEDCFMVGGTSEEHAEMLETMLRLESELERLNVRLADVEPAELADIAWRIDSPELHEIALRIEAGLKEQGLTFADTPASVLTDLAARWTIPA